MLGFIKKKLQQAALEKQTKNWIDSIDKYGAEATCILYLTPIIKEKEVHDLFLCGFEKSEDLAKIRYMVRFAASSAMTEMRKKLLVNHNDDDLRNLNMYERAYIYTYYHISEEEKASVSAETAFDYMSDFLLNYGKESYNFDYFYRRSPYIKIMEEKRKKASLALENFRNAPKEKILSFVCPVKIKMAD
ncbi:hypothetical protein F9K77_07075 [Ochrobactrum sp. LMG 5442]|nr:hypothetical protein F9K77_07075 [Ochrobactrum sp. LMG 5442]